VLSDKNARMIAQKGLSPKAIDWQKLAQELAERGDLPGTAEIIQTVTQITPEDEISAQELAALILRDYGLTKRVIQMANSCFYNPQGVEIATISKAIIFLGFEVIRKIALAANFLEEILRQTPDDRRHLVLSLLSQSFFSAFLGGRLGPQLRRTKEEVFIHVLFHRLVRVLLAMHYPEEYLFLRQLEREKPAEVKEKLFLLGEFLGKKWSFPRSLVDSFEGSPRSEEEKHLASWVVSIDSAARAIIRENDPKALKSLLNRLKLEEDRAGELVEFAYRATKELYQPLSKHLTFWREKAEEPRISASPAKEEFFQKALAEITALLASPESKYQEVLFMVVETICRAFDCEGVLFGLYNPGKGGLVVRFAVGAQNGRFKGALFPVGSVLADIFRKKVEWAGKKSAIPEFQKISLPSETDILFSPLIVFDKPLGMIMAFRKRPFSTEEAQKISILKNLAVMSITQAQAQRGA